MLLCLLVYKVQERQLHVQNMLITGRKKDGEQL